MASDGRDFIPQALEKGAVAILADGPVEGVAVPVITADEPRHALAMASARFYARQPEIVAAVTGTNGKSSTVDFLRQIWTHVGVKGASLGTLGLIGPEGSVDLGHTTPDPVAIHQNLDALAASGATHLAMEASSHGMSPGTFGDGSNNWLGGMTHTFSVISNSTI